MFTAKWFAGLFSGVMFIISILIFPFVAALFAPQVHEAALGYGLLTLYIMAGILALVLFALPFMVHFGQAMREFTSGLAFPLLLTSLGSAF